MGGTQLPIGIGDLEEALRDDTRVTAQHWKVAANPAPTATVFGVTDLAGAPVVYGPKALAALVGAVAEFLTGALAGDAAAATPKQGALVTAAALGGAPQTVELTVEALFSAAPAAGDEVALLATPTTTGTQNVNITGATIQVPTYLQSVLQPLGASTSIALAANGVWTSAAFDTSNGRSIVGSIYTDQGGTLQVQQAPDGANWDSIVVYNVPAGVEVPISVEVRTPGAGNARLVLTNGPVAETILRAFVYSSPLPARVTRQAAYSDGSGTLAAAGTSQQVFAAYSERRKLLIQNPSSETESLWVEYGGAAVEGQPSIEILPGGSIDEADVVDIRTVNVIAATLGHPFTAKQA